MKDSAWPTALRILKGHERGVATAESVAFLCALAANPLPPPRMAEVLAYVNSAHNTHYTPRQTGDVNIVLSLALKYLRAHATEERINAFDGCAVRALATLWSVGVTDYDAGSRDLPYDIRVAPMYYAAFLAAYEHVTVKPQSAEPGQDQSSPPPAD